VFITDPVPTNTKLRVNDLGGACSGPVIFTNGSPSSGLTYTFTSLSSSTDDLSFSNNGGASYTYTPTAGTDGCDANVTNIQVNPKGTFALAGAGNPSFSLTYQVCVKWLRGLGRGSAAGGGGNGEASPAVWGIKRVSVPASGKRFLKLRMFRVNSIPFRSTIFQGPDPVT
jgi:hypothetical protein